MVFLVQIYFETQAFTGQNVYMKIKANSELSRVGIKWTTERFDYLEDWPKNWHQNLQSICSESKLLQKLARPVYSLTHAVPLMMIWQMSLTPTN